MSKPRCRFCMNVLTEPTCVYCRENAQKVAGFMQTANVLFRLRGEIFDPILRAKILAEPAAENVDSVKL